MIMSSCRKCLLRCTKSDREIYLEHCKVAVLGRGPKTEITDPKLSKCQVSLVANTKACSVTVRCLGANPCGVNNKKLRKNGTSTLYHDDQLELLLGKYIYKIEFIPPPTEDTINGNQISNHMGNKRQSESLHCDLKRPRLNTNNDVKYVTSIWEEIDNGKLLIYTKEGTENRNKIAAYDLDGTIIGTKSGKVFPQHRDDWNIANSAVKPTLTKLIENGYKVVIFTNQAGISKGKTRVQDFKYKTEQIVEALGIPVQVFIATTDDVYRKPAPGMWDALTGKKNSGLVVNIEESFYVGDAAGREQNWMPKRKKDFSCADRLFALNVGLKFHTPEAHFLKQPEGKYKLPDFNPSSLDCNAPVSDSNITSTNKEVVVMVGSPGAGKSFFVSTYLLPAGYIHVNRDTLGSWQRCISNMETALNQNKSVVIDNTNPDKASRKRYIDVAAKLNTPCRCFILSSTIEHAIHNNKFRQIVNDDHIQVNEIMIHSYKKKYEPPLKEEGFVDIVKVNVVPKFDDPVRERLYKMYLV